MIHRRTALAGALATALTVAAPARAGRSLTLLVGAPPGAGPDLLARSFAPFLERHLPEREVEIRNVPGEIGLRAYRLLAEQRPTGDVLGFVSTPSLTARAIDHADASLLTRLRLLGSSQSEPVVFASPAAAPVESADSLIERTASRREAAALGTPPAGSPGHLAALEVQEAARTPLNIVTFPSSAAARQAAVAGTAAASVLALSDAVAGLREGRLVGVMPARSGPAPVAPEIAGLTVADLPVSIIIRRGLAGPASLGAAAELAFAAVMRAVAEDPEFQAQAAQSGFIADWRGGADWLRLAEAERSRLADLWRAGAWLPSGSG